LLPAPLSSPFTVYAALTSSVARRSQFEQELGRCDASPSTPNAFRTVGYCCIVMLVASSPIVWFQPVRDKSLARRPSRSLRLSPWSVCQRPKAFRTGKAPTPTMEAGDGSRQAVGPDPKTLSVRLAVPTDRCIPPAQLPVRDRSRSASLAAVPSGVVVRPAEAGFPSLLPGRGDSANGCAPLTASAVRQGCSEERARRVFRRCCGHRCRFVQVEFLQLYQGLTPSRAGNFFPSDAQRLLLPTESCKYFL